jgi:dihydrofolate reductase
MRAVTAGLFYSLDGVVESPNLWQFDSFDDELGAGMGGMIERTDTVLMGRKGYQDWAAYWPELGLSDPFAAFINPVEKFVASRTLTGDLEWNNSKLMDAPLLDFVAALKQTEGGEIAVNGSISIVHQLLFAGLLDRLMVMIHPVIAGTGQHLFTPQDPTTRLALVDSMITSKGNVVLTYSLKGD